MKIYIPLMLFALLGLTCMQMESTRQPTQMIVVVTPDWDASTGTMQRYERRSPQARWIRVDESIPVVVGRNGLAWGRGIHEPADETPMKKEGDGRSPAGIFSLGHVFGYVPPEEMRLTRMPYIQATKTLHCVDDVDSKYYNQILDHGAVDMDWHSFEVMQRDDDLYRLGIIVEHNTKPCEPGGGSCIFIHIWRDAETGTSGCTAMSPENIEALIRWLDSHRQPVLVQLPGFIYNQVRETWNLP